MKDYKDLIGRKIVIHGRPLGDMSGFVEDVITTANGESKLVGTWGLFSVNPDLDSIEITDERGIKCSTNSDTMFID